MMLYLNLTEKQLDDLKHLLDCGFEIVAPKQALAHKIGARNLRLIDSAMKLPNAHTAIRRGFSNRQIILVHFLSSGGVNIKTQMRPSCLMMNSPFSFVTHSALGCSQSATI